MANLRPAELVSRLEIQPGSTVVDLGTGTGALLKDLSAAVGSRGRIIAEDIHQDFLDRAKKFAVGGVTAVALWESLKPNYAWAEQVPKDDKRIKVGYETVPSPEGNGVPDCLNDSEGPCAL